MTTPTPGMLIETEDGPLRAYCESRFPVGQPTSRRTAVTGETYTELYVPWADALASRDAARDAAQAHFDRYASDKTGTLYWRVVPEIARHRDGPRFAYYMRLLISDKPHKEA